MNTLVLKAVHECSQLSKQEAEIWTLLQTMNSSQNKRQKYEHSYKPWTTVHIPTLLFWELFMVCRSVHIPPLFKTSYEHSYKPWTALKTRGRNMNTPTWTAFKTRGRNMNTPTNHEPSQRARGVFIFLTPTRAWTALKTRVCRSMNTPTWRAVHEECSQNKLWTLLLEQLSKQEGEIWTLMNSSVQEAEIWTLLQTMNSSQNKREAYEHSYKPRPAFGRNMNTEQLHGEKFPTNHEQLGVSSYYEHSYLFWELFMNSSQNKSVHMNTPTNHEQLSNQEGEIWTLLQTMNSSQNK